MGVIDGPLEDELMSPRMMSTPQGFCWPLRLAEARGCSGVIATVSAALACPVAVALVGLVGGLPAGVAGAVLGCLVAVLVGVRLAYAPSNISLEGASPLRTMCGYP